MMIRTTASIAFMLAAALALPAGAQPGAATGAPPKGPATVYSLEIAGKTGVLLGAQGVSGPRGPATGAPKAPPAARTEITLEAGTGLPQAFYDWVGGALAGRAPPFAATLHGAEVSGGAGVTASLANPRLISISFAALDKTSQAPMRMDVRLQAAVSVEPVKSPKLPKAAQATRWLASGYRLTLGGGLDAGQVTHIHAFTLAPGTGAQLELTVSGGAAGAFARMAPTPKKRAAVGLDDGQLELLGADGGVIATLALHGLQLASFYYGPPLAAGGARPGIVGLMAQRVDLKFAPAMGH